MRPQVLEEQFASFVPARVIPGEAKLADMALFTIALDPFNKGLGVSQRI